MTAKAVKEALVLFHASKIDKMNLLKSKDGSRTMESYIGDKAYIRRISAKDIQEEEVRLSNNGFINVLHDTQC